MAKSFQDHKVKQRKVLKTHDDNFENKQKLLLLKIQKKEAQKFLHLSTRQVEAIEVHKMIVRTDWAALIRIVQVLQLIFKAVKNYAKKKELAHKKNSVKVKLKYILGKNKAKNQKLGEGESDAVIAYQSFFLASKLLEKKVQKKAIDRLTPLFNEILRVTTIKTRCLRFVFSGTLI